MQEIPDKKLYIIVFLTGAIVMVMELVGSRLMAPVLGTSVFVWTSLIGIILGAMSLGYYLGGKLADKKPTLKVFSSLTLAAGIFIFLIIIFKNPILDLSMFFGLKAGSVFAAIFLFSIPALFLGAVSPYAVRLSMKKVESSGNTVGNLYAISTFGSIFGTFLAGFYLIPHFGGTNILYALAIMLFLISLFIYNNKARTIPIIVALFTLFGLSVGSNAMNKRELLADEDSAYSHIRVWETEDKNGRAVLVMSLENSFDSGMFLDSDELVFDYSKYFMLDKAFKKDIKKTVIFGGAAYSIPKEYLAKNKEGEIDVVEIDPRTTKLAKKFFRLEDNERMNIYHEDARIFLNNADKNKKSQYDVVYNDAFNSACSVPFHLTTKEAVGKISNILNDDGLYIMNMISALSGENSGFFRAEYKTLNEKFESIFVFPVRSRDENSSERVQNIVIIASKKKLDINDILKNNQEGEVGELLSGYWKYEVETGDIKVLTDDFAPVNYYASKHCGL